MPAGNANANADAAELHQLRAEVQQLRLENQRIQAQAHAQPDGELWKDKELS